METVVNTEVSTIRAINCRIVYFVFLLYMMFALDRMNISFAALRMNEALGFDPKVYGFGVGLFYVSYMIFQVPSTLLIQRYGIRVFLALSLILWGLPSAGMAFISDKSGFYFLRFMLGMAEAGFGAGVVYYLNNWFPQRYRGTAISMTLLAAPISLVVGGPISGWLLSFSALGLVGWQWLFIVEGFPTILLGVVAIFYLTDVPAEAKWLKPEQRAWLLAELAREQGAVRKSGALSNLAGVLRSGRVWAAAGSLFSLLLGFTGMLYWLPLVIKQMSSYSDLGVSILSTLPWIAMGLGMYFNARHSDRTGERLWHVGGGMFAAALGLIIGATAPAPYNLIALLVAGCGIGAAQGIFWTIPLGFLSGTAVASGVALINVSGSSSGLIGPVLIGWLRQETGSYTQPTYMLAGFLLVGFALLLPLRASRTTVESEALRTQNS